jgi:hypothetical protein
MTPWWDGDTVDLLLAKVFRLVRGVDGVGTLLPASWADLAVLVGELECFDDSDGLLDRSADGQIVNVRGSKGTLGVDEEGASESNTLVLEEDTVGLGNGVRSVGKLWAIRQQSLLKTTHLYPPESG